MASATRMPRPSHQKSEGHSTHLACDASSGGADVVQTGSEDASRGHFGPLATHLPGLSLERTTGFEPATLTLAR